MTACEWPEHPNCDHPCGRPADQFGVDCRHCGNPTPLSGDPCPQCWTPIDIPTFKALMAAEGIDTQITSDKT